MLLVKRGISTVPFFFLSLSFFPSFELLAQVEQIQICSVKHTRLFYIDYKSLIQKREETSSVKSN